RIFLLNRSAFASIVYLTPVSTQNCAYPFASACVDFEEPFPFGGFTETSLSGSGINARSTTCTISVGGPWSVRAVGGKALPSPSVTSRTSTISIPLQFRATRKIAEIGQAQICQKRQVVCTPFIAPCDAPLDM